MRKRFAFLLLWLGTSLSGWAQQERPCFLAYKQQQNQAVETFCVGETITFKDNSGRPNVTEFYDFDARDGVTPDQLPQHVFTAPGTYTVTQLTGVGNLCPRTFVVKAAAPPSAPVLQKIALQGTSIQIQLQTSGVNDLVVESASSPTGPFTTLETLSSVATGQSQHSIAVSSASGCFRVRVTNLCSEREDIISNVVCTQSLAASAGDRQNVLSWSANASSGSVTGYQLLRGGQLYQTFAAGQTTYTDAQVACGRRYTYQLIALLQNGGQSASLPVEVETRGTSRPAAALLVASFDLQNRVLLETKVPGQETFKEQSVYRSQGGAFNLISEKQPQNTVDPAPGDLRSGLCYQIAYLDSCNLSSGQSNSACPSILIASAQANGAVQLTWNSYEGFPTDVGTQTLQLLDEQGTVYWSTSVTGQSYLDAQPQTKFQRLTYRLLSVSPDAAYQSFSNTSSVDQGFQFSFPTAFTPNNDGLNDVFRPVGAPFASSFILQVLNRWGQIIFESKDPKAGWDGTHRGKPAPPETYIYRMEAVDVNGKKITQKGTVTLIR
ncbi:T9SS type B sorting domain-containing protein [Rufibacter sediminis]|uniref:Gliding motility-associated C-terminal domain-containing protein n=1 Tax=Rufibacter sediminis TaxID=2762756 RepID=A0ABR6VLU9_9BACT|nr:T9SS type B sorting domain-containing protein [Rufibacter sediminis]MBC3538118.1 gliding motility-associated C-terminal domain-containing protein [Rufibacter sediminis]